MPDPVCAALAMGMMHEKWVLTNFQGVDPIAGEATIFWSKKAMELLSSGLCLPEKGNPGEIMVALYMLFCGDLLRYRQDQTLRHFSVPLEEWFRTLKSPRPPSTSSSVGGVPLPTPPSSQNLPLDTDLLNAVSCTDAVGSSCTQELHSQTPATNAVPRRLRLRKSASASELRLHQPSTADNSINPPVGTETLAGLQQGNQSMPSVPTCKLENQATLTAYVNFIQVCRNYFRANSWGTHAGLKWMYESSTATYVYPYCPAIDLVAAIRVTRQTRISYHPLLVSVECYTQFFPGDITKAKKKMDALLKTVRKQTNEYYAALCLLVLIGSERATNVPESTYGRNDLFGFPGLDTFRFVWVPHDDPFEISAAVSEMTSAYAMAEVFSSHGYVYGENKNKSTDVLRSLSQQKEIDYVSELFRALS